MALGINLGILSQETSTDFQNIYSLDFDGVDDYVDCGNSAALKPNIITVSCWIKGSTQTAYTRIISQDGPTGGADAYGFYVTTALNKVVFAIKTDVTGTVTSATSGVVLDNSWHHLVGTYDGSEVILYVDGVAIGSPVAGTSILNYGIGGLTIGCFSEPTTLPDYLFNGNIDEVSIFDSVIPIGDLWDGSEKPTDLTSLNPLAWYRMGDNGSYKSPQWLIPSNENKDKVSNYSLELDGIDDYIDLGNDSSLDIFGSDFTISLWAKWGAQTSNSNGLINFAANTNKAVITLGFSTQYGKISFGTGNSSTVGILYDCGSGYDDDNWHHIMCTLQGSTRTVYVDGVDISSTGNGSSIGVGSNNDIGNRARSRYFNGNIDEVSIFDSVIPIGDLWDGSGEPTTISGAVAHWRMGEEATFSGGVWTVPDQIGSNDGTSNAMTIEDRVGVAPSSSNNAISFNMDFEDRVTDVPT